MAFTRVGKGMLGFVGDVNVDRDYFEPRVAIERRPLSEDSVKIVMAMCRLLD